MLQKNQIKVEKTARYYLSGELNKSTKNIWFVCHGYGQLAEYFIRKFEVLSNSETVVVAPEALNRFYLNGFSGRVGASWMTKDDRENDIIDYCHYLNEVYADLNRSADLSSLNFNVLGFSQGVATVCRWVAFSDIQVHNLVLWAGVFPPDLNKDFEFSIKKFVKKNITIVYGDQDPFLKEEHNAQLEEMRKIKPDLKLITFYGGHDIDSETLKTLQDGKLS